VRVPTGLAQHVEPLLRAMPGEQVLDRARKHVVDTGLAVRGRWTLEEHEAPGGVARFQRALEEPLGPPLRQQLALEIVRPSGLRDLGVFLRGMRRGHARSSDTTPRTSVVSAGCAAFAAAMIWASVVASSVSGTALSVITLTPSTRIPACTATMTSGTVDMPTTSAPSVRTIRYSARVSRLGPDTATYTPS